MAGAITASTLTTLVAFLPILWGLSGGVDLPYIKDIPGSLVWVALLVSFGIGMQEPDRRGRRCPSADIELSAATGRSRQQLAVMRLADGFAVR